VRGAWGGCKRHFGEVQGSRIKAQKKFQFENLKSATATTMRLQAGLFGALEMEPPLGFDP
jgi:hypothetical protein